MTIAYGDNAASPDPSPTKDSPDTSKRVKSAFQIHYRHLLNLIKIRVINNSLIYRKSVFIKKAKTTAPKPKTSAVKKVQPKLAAGRGRQLVSKLIFTELKAGIITYHQLRRSGGKRGVRTPLPADPASPNQPEPSTSSARGSSIESQAGGERTSRRVRANVSYAEPKMNRFVVLSANLVMFCYCLLKVQRFFILT